MRSSSASLDASSLVHACIYRVAQKSKLLYCDNSLLYLSHPVHVCIGRSLSYKKFNASRRLTEVAGCLIVGLAAVSVFVISLVCHCHIIVIIAD